LSHGCSAGGAPVTYTLPKLTDVLYICGYPLTMTFAGRRYHRHQHQSGYAAIDWMNDLIVTGTPGATMTLTRRTVDAYNAPATPVTGLGPYGNSVTIKSAGLHSASLSHADMTGGATSAKGVRLVKSTGTVANGGAVITSWLNEYNPGSSGNPNTGSIATGFVVVGRAS
jgi:hypothetical protein